MSWTARFTAGVAPSLALIAIVIGDVGRAGPAPRGDPPLHIDPANKT